MLFRSLRSRCTHSHRARSWCRPLPSRMCFPSVFQWVVLPPVEDTLAGVLQVLSEAASWVPPQARTHFSSHDGSDVLLPACRLCFPNTVLPCTLLHCHACTLQQLTRPVPAARPCAGLLASTPAFRRSLRRSLRRSPTLASTLARRWPALKTGGISSGDSVARAPPPRFSVHDCVLHACHYR